MKALLPTLVTGACILSIVAFTPPTEFAPPGLEAQIQKALPAKAHSTVPSPRKLLVFSKTNGFRHPSIPTGKLALEYLGKHTGAYTAIISDDLAEFETPKLQSYDAVCFLSTTQNVFLPHPKTFEKLSPQEQLTATQTEQRLKENLLAFIQSGKGFIGIHAAANAFPEWPQYSQMLNGKFDGHPWQANAKVSIQVEPGQHSHPLVSMFKGQNIDLTEEIYQFSAPYDSNAALMLLRLDPSKTNMSLPDIHRKDNDFGVSWIRRWGKGRVFYCSLGHNHHIFAQPEILSHYLAGIQWALGDIPLNEASIPLSK